MGEEPIQSNASDEKFAGRDYLTYREAQEFLGGIGATALYYYVRDLGIPRYKFPRHRERYLAIEDVRRIALYMAQPWPISPSEAKQDESS